MILQTNSYIVPKEKRAEHARLVARFRQCLSRLGCDHFECYEQVGANWNADETTGRFVQIMRFRDRKQQQKVQSAERSDPAAQALIKEFCEMINFPYQQQQGLFVVGFYSSVLAVAPSRVPELSGGLDAEEPAEQSSKANGESHPPTNGESEDAQHLDISLEDESGVDDPADSPANPHIHRS